MALNLAGCGSEDPAQFLTVRPPSTKIISWELTIKIDAEIGYIWGFVAKNKKVMDFLSAFSRFANAIYNNKDLS